MMQRHYKRWTLRLLRCYPRAWRERYAEEMEATLNQHEGTVMTLVDLLRGALDAHLHPSLLPDGSIPAARRVRNSEIAIFCAFALFSVAWLPLQGIRDPLPIWENAVQPHPEIRAAFDVVQIAGFVAFLAIAAGGLPYLALLARRAVCDRRRDIPLLLTVPFLAMALLAAYGLLASSTWTQRQTAAPDAPFTLRAVALQFGLLAMIALAAVGSAAAIILAVARSEPDARMARYALIPATVATLAMVFGWLATLMLCMLTIMEAPPLRSFGDVPVLFLMGSAAALAVIALHRGLRQRAG